MRDSELDRRACLAHLATATIGRVVFTEQALPAAQPVSFFLAGEEVIFRAPSRGPLAAASPRRVVGFQVDHIDTATGAGWSVFGVGEVRDATDSRCVNDVALLAQATWAGAPDVRILVLRLSSSPAASSRRQGSAEPSDTGHDAAGAPLAASALAPRAG